jgi:hypothetical protein
MSQFIFQEEEKFKTILTAFFNSGCDFEDMNQ